MAELHQQARALASTFDSVTYEWIPREQNKYADRLANEAMDAAAADPPGEAVAVPPAAWTGNQGAPTRLLLLRHGQTEFSRQRRYSGRGNPELTDTGRRQADAAARYLAERGGIDAVITSPLRRAYDTAAAAATALGLDVTVDDDLIETDFGAWEGLTFAEARERDPDLHGHWLRDTSLRPPAGESFDDVQRPGSAAPRADHRRASGQHRAGGLARDADQDSAAAGAGRRHQHPAPAAPGPGVAEHRGVLSRRRFVGAAGEPDLVSGLSPTAAGAPVHRAGRTG